MVNQLKWSNLSSSNYTILLSLCSSFTHYCFQYRHLYFFLDRLRLSQPICLYLISNFCCFSLICSLHFFIKINTQIFSVFTCRIKWALILAGRCYYSPHFDYSFSNIICSFYHCIFLKLYVTREEKLFGVQHTSRWNPLLFASSVILKVVSMII